MNTELASSTQKVWGLRNCFSTISQLTLMLLTQEQDCTSRTTVTVKVKRSLCSQRDGNSERSFVIWWAWNPEGQPSPPSIFLAVLFSRL